LTFNAIDDSMTAAQPGPSMLREAAGSNADEGRALSALRSDRAVAMLGQLDLDAAVTGLDSDRWSAMFPAHDRERAMYGINHEAQAREDFQPVLKTRPGKAGHFECRVDSTGGADLNPTRTMSMPVDSRAMIG
jgi:hypothetical protein